MAARIRERAKWHLSGLLLWLVRRPSLRYVPFPYPSVGNVTQWLTQAEMMVANGALPKKSMEKGKTAQVFTVQNLTELRWFRDRLGWRAAFLEDPLMEGMLLARDSKKISARLRDEASEEARKEAQQAMARGAQEEAVRSLLGPRGGLPHLRGDLVKLAHLLHLEVGSKDTIDDLKGKIKPMIAVLSMQTPAQKKGVAMATPKSEAAASRSISASPPSQELQMSDLKTHVTQEQLARLLIDQEGRFKSMVQETLAAMMSYQPAAPGDQTPRSWTVPSNVEDAAIPES